jgi:hypothetical protein
MANLFEELRAVVGALGGLADGHVMHPLTTIVPGDPDVLVLDLIEVQAATLAPGELRIALGLAWAAGDLALVRAAVAGLPAEVIAADATLQAFRDASSPGAASVGSGSTTTPNPSEV